MIIKAKYLYEEPYLPPRCRKLRYRDVGAEVELEIPETTKDETPLVFRHWNIFFPGEIREYRMYQDSLYSRATERNPIRWVDNPHDFLVSRLDYPRSYPSYDASLRSKEDGEMVLRDYASEYLLIEQEVWEKCGEPYYQIRTYGFSGNHGGTALSIDNSVYIDDEERDNEFYSALDYELALEEALRVATERGDTESLPDIRDEAHSKIEVLDPTAVKLKSQIAWKIPIVWQMSKNETIFAPTLKDAIAKAAKEARCSGGNYVEDSCEVSVSDENYIRDFCNNGKRDAGGESK